MTNGIVMKKAVAAAASLALVFAMCFGAFASAGIVNKNVLPIDLEDQYVQDYASVIMKLKKLYNFYGDDLEGVYEEARFVNTIVSNVLSSIDALDSKRFVKTPATPYKSSGDTSAGETVNYEGEYSFADGVFTDSYSYISPSAKQRVTTHLQYYPLTGRVAYTIGSSEAERTLDLIRSGGAFYIQVFDHYAAYTDSDGEKNPAKTYATRAMLKKGQINISMLVVNKKQIKSLRMTQAPSSWSSFAFKGDIRYEYDSGKLTRTEDGRSLVFD